MIKSVGMVKLFITSVAEYEEQQVLGGQTHPEGRIFVT